MHELVSLVQERYDRARRAQETDFQRIRNNNALYRGEPSQVYMVPTRAQYIVPLAFEAVETVVPRLISVMFSVWPPIQSRYRKQPDLSMGEEFLMNLDRLYALEFEGGQKTFWAVIAWAKDLSMYGKGILKVGWRSKKRTVWIEGEPVSKVVEDCVDVSNVDPLSFFYAEDAKFPDPIGSAQWVIHETKKRRSQVLKEKELGLYGTKAGGEDFALTDLGTAEENVPTKTPESTQETDSKDPFVSIFEHWEDEWVMTTANHKTLLRSEPNPFGLEGRPKQKPFLIAFDHFVPHENSAIGEIEPIAHMQVELSTLRRQRTDNNTMRMNNMFLVDRDAEIEESDFVSRPWGKIRVRARSGEPIDAVIKPLLVPDMSGTSFNDFAAMKNDFKDTLGLLDAAVGRQAALSSTATEVNLLQTAGNYRFDLKVRCFAASMLDLGYMIYERWKQFLTRPVYFHTDQQKSIAVTRDSLPEYDNIELLVPGNAARLQKDQRHQTLLQLYMSAMQNQYIDTRVAAELFKMVLRESDLDGIEPILKLLSAPPQPPMQGGNGSQPGAGAMAGLMGASQPAGLSPSQPPSPAQPPGVPRPGGMVNTNPQIIPSPRPGQ